MVANQAKKPPKKYLRARLLPCRESLDLVLLTTWPNDEDLQLAFVRVTEGEAIEWLNVGKSYLIETDFLGALRGIGE